MPLLLDESDVACMHQINGRLVRLEQLAVEGEAHLRETDIYQYTHMHACRHAASQGVQYAPYRA